MTDTTLHIISSDMREISLNGIHLLNDGFFSPKNHSVQKCSQGKNFIDDDLVYDDEKRDLNPTERISNSSIVFYLEKKKKSISYHR